MIAFFQGFGIGAGLIIAIGAQNSFVLSQGVKKQYVLLIPLICSVCDSLLIFAGAAGVGSFITSRPQIGYYAGIGGALFLFWYGCRSLFSAFTSSSHHDNQNITNGIKSIIFTTLALTLLNPHVYLDTIVLLGSLSGQFDGMARYVFALGASTASFVWFFSLSFGGTLLEPLFRQPKAWKIMDISICLVMWSIAYSIWPEV